MNAVLKQLKQLSHSDRKRYLGGSDVAGIVGVSPWATPADIYYRKLGEEQNVKIDPVREKIYRRGKRLEPVVIEMLKDELGIDVIKVSTDAKPNRYVDPEFDFIAAEVDFEWRVRQEDIDRFPWAKNLKIGSIQNGEIKTVAPFPDVMKLWGEMDTDEVPVYYAFQSLAGLSVTSRDVCLYGALFGSDNLVTYAVPRDEETIVGIRKQLVSFWNDHVLARVIPEPRTIEDLQRMYLKASLETALATSESREHIARLHQVKDEVKALEDVKTELEFQIQHAIGNAEALVDERGKVLATWKNSTYSHLNGTALKEQHPDLHAEFYESRPMRRFLLTGRRNRT